MKPFKLTDKHKSKLLEMCEKLFLDKNHTWFKINLDGEILWVNKKAGIEKIHWYEFCLCHLADKIYPGDYSNKAKFVVNIWASNPIDYLYEEFKKIKK